MTRPPGITAIALLLFGAAVGGVAMAGLSPMFARVGLPWYLFAGVGLTHAVLVAVTGYGLLRMARWAMRMFALWAVVAVIATVLPGVAGAAPKSRVVFTTSVAVATLVAFGLYVRGHLARWQERPVANGVE